MRVFVDSNVPMYAAGGEHPHRASSVAFLEKVRDGEIEGCTSTEALQEILYRYSAIDQTGFGMRVYDLFVEVCPIVLPVSLADTDRARDLLEELPRMGVRDLIHAAVMLNSGVPIIATHDRGFDRIPGIERFDFDSL